MVDLEIFRRGFKVFNNCQGLFEIPLWVLSQRQKKCHYLLFNEFQRQKHEVLPVEKVLV